MKSLFVIAIVSLMALTSYAQQQTPRANTRQKSQRVRIADGRQDGELTNKEAAALNTQQRHIRRTERRAKADGEVTTAEKATLERKQDRANRNIRRAKNNNREKND
jgi:hypothetical protein